MNAVRPDIDPFAHLTGMLDNGEQIARRLADIQAKCHLISPRSTCVALKPGCAVSFDAVRVNPKVEAYPLTGGGGYALSRPALLRLANAAGVVWNGAASYRADQGTHPHYCHWHAEGGLVDLDGALLPQDDDFQMDLRDGSAQYEKCFAEARGDSAEECEARARRTLMQKRSKILELAQTGAKLRVIRKLLSIRSYALAELALPFVVARLVYLGHDEDPEIERDNKRAIRDHFLGGARALFGGDGPRLRMLPAARPVPELPPVGTVLDDEDDPPAPRAKPLAPACDYCGVLEGVKTRQTPAGPIHHCSGPECLDLAIADATRPPQTSATGSTTPPQGTAGASTKAPPVAGPSYPQGDRSSPRPAGAAAPGASTQAQPRASGSAPGARGGTSGFLVPGNGREGGFPIEQATDRTLEYWIDRLARKLGANKTPPRYRAEDETLLDAMRAELARRRAADAESPPVDDFAEGAGVGDDDIPY